MTREKVLYIAEDTLTISGLSYFLQEYTKNNGCYPDFIEMDEDRIEKYQSLLFSPSDKNNLTFHGIKIREVR
jgi:hypothetical protein